MGIGALLKFLQSLPIDQLVALVPLVREQNTLKRENYELLREHNDLLREQNALLQKQLDAAKPHR